MPDPRPIDAVLPQLVDALESGRDVLLKAPTGAGKTTRVPVAIDDCPTLRGAVTVLEPRRVAARQAARRMAHETDSRLGERIGYGVRFDDRMSESTQVRVVTGGIYLAKIQDDPFLEGVGVVIFDEFHERSVESDLALAMTAKVQREVRPDLRIVVMSATLEIEALEGYLDNCEVVESEGRSFPVDLRYVPPAEAPAAGRFDADLTARYARTAYGETDGDVLVFLPGVGEIKRTESVLVDWAQRSGAELAELHGGLDGRAQDAVFAPSERRRVVLATNVAEASVTLPRIKAVVDTGLARTLRYDTATGMDRLELGPISRSSAKQRQGRAGRIAPGICYRLWTMHEDRARPASDAPEIARVDPAGPLLELAAWGESDPMGFRWLTAPAASAAAGARALLETLGALETGTDAWRLTHRGRDIVKLPLHPRLAALVLAGVEGGVAREAASAAALLSERPILRRSRERGAPSRTSPNDCDLRDELEALDGFTGRSRSSYDGLPIAAAAARAVAASARQILSLVGKRARETRAADADRALSRAIFAAFPDRLAVRRGNDRERAVMAGGRGVRLDPGCGVRNADLFVCLDLDSRSGDALLRRASAVELQDIPEAFVREELEATFDEETGRVDTRRVKRAAGVALESKTVRTERRPETAAILFEAARKNVSKALELDDAELVQLLARIETLRTAMPELGLAEIGDAFFETLLEELCRERISFDELRKAPLRDAVVAALGWEAQAALDREAPERVKIPSGSRIRLEYRNDGPPVLAARIQELFGWKTGPTIAGGRVRVLIHLLAPNMRPAQVTDDLENFWNVTYTEVRKELRRRYPKHDWPDNPWEATPSRRPGRRR